MRSVVESEVNQNVRGTSLISYRYFVKPQPTARRYGRLRRLRIREAAPTPGATLGCLGPLPIAGGAQEGNGKTQDTKPGGSAAEQPLALPSFRNMTRKSARRNAAPGNPKPSEVGDCSKRTLIHQCTK